MKRIAVFGGSFDPVHNEHVSLAKAAIEGLGLDKLFVMPAFAPPHKPGKILSPDVDRMEMCRLAFEGLPQAEISDYEIARGGTSYTYLTCTHFKELYPDAEIFWLVGTDMLRDFPTWKYPEKILDCVTLAVCARNEKKDWLQREKTAFYQKFGRDFAVIGYHGADVSSTKIRVFAGAGMELTQFLPKKVAAYIRKKRLYEISGASAALALEKPERAAHSLRVAELAASRAVSLKISEKKAIAAALFHDCAKNLSRSSPYLEGFSSLAEWGDIPEPVLHQFTGAYVAENRFGVEDEDILNAIRYHTSARPNMSELEKLIFLADMLEPTRKYQGVDELRTLFWDKEGLDKCVAEALYQTLLFLKEKGGVIYPLTRAAYEFYKDKRK